jgi:hypothetical protein
MVEKILQTELIPMDHGELLAECVVLGGCAQMEGARTECGGSSAHQNNTDYPDFNTQDSPNRLKKYGNKIFKVDSA